MPPHPRSPDVAGVEPATRSSPSGLGIGDEHALDFDRIIGAIIVVIIDFVAGSDQNVAQHTKGEAGMWH